MKSNTEKEEKEDVSSNTLSRSVIKGIAASFHTAIVTLSIDNPRVDLLLNKDNTLPTQLEALRYLKPSFNGAHKDDATLVNTTILLLNCLEPPEGLFLWRAYFSISRKNLKERAGFSKSSYYRNLQLGITHFLDKALSNPAAQKVYKTQLTTYEERLTVQEAEKKLLG